MNNFFANLSIVTKILIVSTLLAGIFLGGSFGYATLSLRTQLRSALLTALEQRLLGEISSTEQKLEIIQSTVLALSKTPPIQGIIRSRNGDGYDLEETSTYEQWTSRLESIFSAEINSNRVFLQLRYLDEDGNELVRVNLVDNKAEIVPQNQLQNKGQRDYFKKGMQTQEGDIYISEVNLNREGTDDIIIEPYQPVIRYVVPIFDQETNQRKGVVVANVLADEVFSFSSDFVNSQSLVYLVDQSGYYIKHPNPEFTWGSPTDLNSGKNLYQEFPTITPEKLEPDQIEIFIVDNDIFAAGRIAFESGNEKPFWYVLKRVSVGDAFAALNQVTSNALLLGVLTFLLLFFVFLFALRKMLSPLKQLTEATHSVGEGNLDTEVTITSKDEVGQLAEAFNQMIHQLRQSYSSLEEKVETRTEELTRTNQLMVGREVKMAELKKKIKHLEEKNNKETDV